MAASVAIIAGSLLPWVSMHGGTFHVSATVAGTEISPADAYTLLALGVVSLALAARRMAIAGRATVASSGLLMVTGGVSFAIAAYQIHEARRAIGGFDGRALALFAGSMHLGSGLYCAVIGGAVIFLVALVDTTLTSSRRARTESAPRDW